MLELRVGTRHKAKTAKRLGLNIEVHDGEDQSNLWDWLADSGAQAVREFHPEQSLRKEDAPTDRWDSVTDLTSFQAFRQSLAADPETEIPWDTYLFDTVVKWMGIPDKIVEHVTKVGPEPVCSLGFSPTSYRESLINDLYAEALSDELIHWSAAAAAYEYYLAEIYRYATRHNVRYYSLRNEPEWSSAKAFYLPPELDKFQKRLRDLVTCRDPDAYAVYGRALGLQVAAMARIARWAADDVQVILQERGQSLPILIAGPTSGMLWEPLWAHAKPYADICNYHVYAVTPVAHDRLSREVARQTQGKLQAITEFGRQGGPMKVEDFLFSLDRSLEAARVIMTALQLSKPDDPDYEFLTFYLFAGPSTHRNFKQLVYGDMNMLNWFGPDKALRQRGDNWYPTFDELQIRWATPAYAMYRMLARNTSTAVGQTEPCPVLDSGNQFPWDADVSATGHYESLIVDQGDRLIVNLLNPCEDTIHDLRIMLNEHADRFPYAVVRVCDIDKRDEVIAWHTGRVAIDLPGQTFIQIIYLKDDLASATDLRIEEETYTPGSLDTGLALHQTTRLRAIAQIAGRSVDITELNVLWSSSEPEYVRMEQGGLVQRLRASEGPVTLTAQILNGPSAEVTLQPHDPDL